MKKHVHQLPSTCQCWLLADEPNELCPVHGLLEWPRRCELCGRYFKEVVSEDEAIAQAEGK